MPNDVQLSEMSVLDRLVEDSRRPETVLKDVEHQARSGGHSKKEVSDYANGPYWEQNAWKKYCQNALAQMDKSVTATKDEKAAAARRIVEITKEKDRQGEFFTV
jgi:hypothetical protein